MCNIILRPSGYYFRLTIPIDIRPIIGIREIKRSLQTRSLCLAKEKAYLISGRLKKLFRLIRSYKVELTKEAIEEIINQYIKEGLESLKESRLPDHPYSLAEYEDDLETKHILRSEYAENMMLHNYKAVQDTVDQILELKGIEPERETQNHKRLCHSILKANLGFIDVDIARFRGDHAFQFPYKTLGFPEKVHDSKTEDIQESPTLNNLLDDWFHENKKAKNWKPRTLKQYAGHFTVMMQILGPNIPIKSIDIRVVRDLKEVLLKLPSGMNKKKIFQGKSIQEIIKINETESHETLNINTINSYLITLGAFFKWCVGNGYITTNYAEGIKIKVNRKTRPDELRKIFFKEHLNQLFHSPAYTEDSFEHPYQFWLPILGLFTGARINELCQLRLSDIQEVDDILSLILQEDPDDYKISLKNTASHRTIPLHPFLTDSLNFKGYVDTLKDKGETRLFPELPYQNYSYGHVASKWFQSFKSQCGIESSKLVFHSFRHTLSDNLKQQMITETLIDELTGHAIQGETMGRYGKRYTVKILYDEAVLKLNYGVDLSHLEESKWIYK